jgi:hypothetical protein
MADRPKLPYIDLVGFKGLFTKTSPDVNQPEQLRIAENCDFFKTYGAIAKLKGNSRILASIYKESTVAQPMGALSPMERLPRWLRVERRVFFILQTG